MKPIVGALILVTCWATSVEAADASLDAPVSAAAGSRIQVKWIAAGAAQDFISVDAPDAPASSYGSYAYPSTGNPVTLVVPDAPGAYSIRYHSGGAGYPVLATTPLQVTAVTATLQSSPTVAAGGELSVVWTGPNNTGDFISIDGATADERSYGNYAYAAKGSPLSIHAPDVPGDYAVRYHTATNHVLAAVPVTVTDVTASVSVAGSVAAGADVSVTWSGPGRAGDYISIDAPGAADANYGPYVYPANAHASVVVIRAPDVAGDYEVRYHLAGSNRVIASIPLQVGGVGATLDALAQVPAGSRFDVAWTGPNQTADFISIDALDAPPRTYGAYAYPGKANPVSIRAPDEAGDYQLRYHMGQSYAVIGTRAITVVPANATLAAPAQVVAGSIFDVTWTGPDNEGDFITVVEPTAAARQYGASNGYTRRGNPARLEAPATPGDYQLRYLTGQTYTALATAPLAVTPGTTPGHLRVVSDAAQSAGSFGAVEFLLDASGSMLQRIGEQRRIELAKTALIDLASHVLPADTPFALRVFGNREADSCRTDLEIPRGPLDVAAAVARIKSINAMNLAKTPIGASLLKVADDLAGVEGPTVVVLVTDGEETCEGDPRTAIVALRKAGFDVRVNIVGFAIDEVTLKDTFEEWARLGGGGFYDAQNGDQLQRAMRATLLPTYEVLAEDIVIATGAVNGEVVDVLPGTYQVRLRGAQPRDLGSIQIASGAATELHVD